jgi:hypothetical protein
LFGEEENVSESCSPLTPGECFFVIDSWDAGWTAADPERPGIGFDAGLH